MVVASLPRRRWLQSCRFATLLKLSTAVSLASKTAPAHSRLLHLENRMTLRPAGKATDSGRLGHACRQAARDELAVHIQARVARLLRS